MIITPSRYELARPMFIPTNIDSENIFFWKRGTEVRPSKTQLCDGPLFQKIIFSNIENSPQSLNILIIAGDTNQLTELQ